WWRVGLILLVPLVVLTWVGVGLLIVGMLIYLALAGLIYLPWQWFAAQPRNVAMVLFGRDLVEGRETGSPTPVWMETALLWCTRVVHAPLAACLLALLSWTAFRRIRTQLLPFLVSRCVVAGAGMVDDEGKFLVADKAPAINCVLGLGGFLKDRPIFTFGHFFKAICVEAWLSPRDYFCLLRRRQRLQIGLGDSNMAEMAEFLRVGTTALVLDVIESGEMPPLPALQQPVQALHQLCGDASLTCTVPLDGGQRVTALQLQRVYLEACQTFLRRRPEASAEAHEVVGAWEEVLDALEQLQLSGEVPQSLIGTVDWVTKKHLLEEAGQDASWEALKKIDLCYHELSPLGYFQMLQAAGLAATLASPQELERAMRTAPANSPATMRGHYIREFSSDTEELSVNWKRVVIGRGFGSKSIRLARYDRPASVPSEPPRLGTHDPGRSNMP
ncbi:MAG: proteasome accessory factor PafA2 family protein, partial [Pirellulaceae bacterium]